MTATHAIQTETPSGEVNPEHILQIGMGFWASKTLLSAVELGLFTELNGGGLTAVQIADRLDLHERSRDDFLDALVSLGLLARDGDGPGGVYSNTPDTAVFLDKGAPAYLGGILEMASARLYGFWGSLTEALHTGRPQNEIKTGATGLFDAVYADPDRLENFLNGMTGLQIGAFTALSHELDLSGHTSFCDIGGANGGLAAMIAAANPHLIGSVFDLAPVAPIAGAHLARNGVADRVTAVAGDFFVDDFPAADVYFMGNVLHDWDETEKQALIDKAYAGLPSGGLLVVIENIIDDARRSNSFGLLMSLNMLIELPGGFDYTGAQFDTWARTAGFARTEVRHLAGPSSAAIAYKD
jgi:O-methyltransferase domain/Dimerisation domain